VALAFTIPEREAGRSPPPAQHQTRWTIRYNVRGFLL